MVPDETSDLPTTLPEASFLNPNRKVPSEARSLRGLFPVPVFAEFPSYSLSKNADGFLQNPFWLSYCNLRKLKNFLPFLDTGTKAFCCAATLFCNLRKFPLLSSRFSLKKVNFFLNNVL